MEPTHRKRREQQSSKQHHNMAPQWELYACAGLAWRQSTFCFIAWIRREAAGRKLCANLVGSRDKRLIRTFIDQKWDDTEMNPSNQQRCDMCFLWFAYCSALTYQGRFQHRVDNHGAKLPVCKRLQCPASCSTEWWFCRRLLPSQRDCESWCLMRECSSECSACPIFMLLFCILYLR